MPPRTLDEWLVHGEQQHPQNIALGLERVGQVAQRLALKFAAPVITVAGTNGKGSTCSYLESIARAAGYRVGLYIKPHLVRFEERCRVQGQPVAPEQLVPHFEAVEQARQGVPLTYFEFTTLAIVRLLAQEPLDLVILEVGLGGRLDAVNIIDPDCAVVTSVDVDHVEFLGPDRESIGWEKAGIFRPGKPAIVSDPQPPQRLLQHAQSIGAHLHRLGHEFGYTGDRQQWLWWGPSRRLSGMAYPALRGVNQLLNASGALAALDALSDRLVVSAQAIRQGLAQVELPGRFQIIPGEPVVVLDVAHNPHAVAALAHNLDQMGFYPRTHAVLGCMADKDIEALFRLMAPLVDVWHLCDLPLPRAARAQDLQARARRAGVADAIPVHTHAGPAQALAQAIAQAEPKDRIVAFGSFYTVGGILEAGIPRLHTPHGVFHRDV